MLIYYKVLTIHVQAENQPGSTTVVAIPEIRPTESPDNFCVTNDINCLNGATCINYNSTYKVCRCRQYWTGARCEISITYWNDKLEFFWTWEIIELKTILTYFSYNAWMGAKSFKL